MNINEFSRIHWACRRGMLELDHLLGSYFLTSYVSLTEQEQHYFIDLLACADQDLFRWLLGETEPDHAAFQPLCKKIREHYKSTH